MTEAEEKVCVGCGDTEANVRLERCPMCEKSFCPDCAYRGVGRRFCSAECSRAFFYGDTDDLEDFEPGEIDYD